MEEELTIQCDYCNEIHTYMRKRKAKRFCSSQCNSRYHAQTETHEAAKKIEIAVSKWYKKIIEQKITMTLTENRYFLECCPDKTSCYYAMICGILIGQKIHSLKETAGWYKEIQIENLKIQDLIEE